MGQLGLIVGVTGGTGHLGRLLLERLLFSSEIEEIRSVARRPLNAHHLTSKGAEHSDGFEADRRRQAKFVHTTLDLSSASPKKIIEAFGQVDLMFHLGFSLWSRPGQQERMRQANLACTEAMLRSRPSAVVLASSAAVYGAWPDNPLLIREDRTPAPNDQCPYASQKLVAEKACQREAPTIALRIAAVLGAHADPAVLKAARAYRFVVPSIWGVRQAIQFVHEQDVVAAFVAAGVALRNGAYDDPHPLDDLPKGCAVVNIATADWLDAPEISQIAGGRIMRLPRSAILGFAQAAHRMGLVPFGADRAVLLGGPLSLSIEKAASTLGWRPTRTSRSVLADVMAKK